MLRAAACGGAMLDQTFWFHGSLEEERTPRMVAAGATSTAGAGRLE